MRLNGNMYIYIYIYILHVRFKYAKYAKMHTYMRVIMNMYKDVCIDAHVSRTHTHTYTHVYTHTYTYIHTYRRKGSQLEPLRRLLKALRIDPLEDRKLLYQKERAVRAAWSCFVGSCVQVCSCMYACVSMFMYVCVRTVVYVCMRAYSRSCMYVCVLLYMYVCVRIDMWTHSRSQNYARPVVVSGDNKYAQVYI